MSWKCSHHLKFYIQPILPITRGVDPGGGGGGAGQGAVAPSPNENTGGGETYRFAPPPQ